MRYSITYEDLGLVDFKKAWDYQESILAKMVGVKTGKIQDDGSELSAGNLLLCEHPHVYTIGKSGSEQNLLIHKEELKTRGASYYRINRGGDITYHGPGQIVGYPILDLEKLGLGVKNYVHLLEEAIILTLKKYGLMSQRLDGATGVWVNVSEDGNPRKICAIGVRISRYVTMHGFALNVKTDLDFFRYINPCGFVDKGVTSLDQELDGNVNIETVKLDLKNQLTDVFQVNLAD